MRIISAIFRLCKIGLNVVILKIRCRLSKKYRAYCADLWERQYWEADKSTSRKCVYLNVNLKDRILKEKGERMCKTGRQELIRKVIHVAGLPPGKESDNYFTKEQLEVLHSKFAEMKLVIHELSEQVATLTERILDNDRSESSES